MIETENLTRRFGNLTAVDDLSLRIDDGEIFGLLGPNGAGKTTTVRMLCCLISKTSGGARIGGFDIGKKEDCTRIRKMIGLLPENTGLYESLSAYQNLDFYGRLNKRTEAQRKDGIEHYLKLLGLWEKRDLPAGTFSKGMKQKLAICRALIHDPQILFLDEPTANLDPEASKTVRDFILELKKEDKTIFLNTHHLEEAERICDRVGIMNTKLVAVGAPEALRGSLLGRRTEVSLEQVNDKIIAAVTSLGTRKVEVVGNKLLIEANEPDKETPDIVEAIVEAGGRVRSVSEIRPSLEDVYLKLVRSG
jgi:ABC-2 type transport system ATP-binding protein